ncbi:MAG TPA: PLP-dependent aminotransferase family protein [Thermoanaerobaculaceae bacterium]|nr:PLP-dependent aminotransferase family protein [Thermoanaerobaculaceae bacterium]
MTEALVSAARRALRAGGPGPVYLRLAEALGRRLASDGSAGLPSARRLASEIGLNRATVTAAYRELARRGLLVLRVGRPGRGGAQVAVAARADQQEQPGGTLDLARYAPDRQLLPVGNVFRWLGLGDGEGEGVAQYGDYWGYQPLREFLSRRLRALGVGVRSEGVLLTAGVQHGLDLILRAVARPGDTVLVEDPTYPGLPPLLAMHQLHAVGMRVHINGLHPEEVGPLVERARPRLAIITPTLQNPSGVVLDEKRRRALLSRLLPSGCMVVEEFFEPGLVCDGDAPPPLAALDPRVMMVGSFSKALFPGLRVGWLVGPREPLAQVAAVKRAADLGGSPFLEAAAWALCRRGVLEEQLARLRSAARVRLRVVRRALADAPAGVGWSEPRGGFSLVMTLPPGWSSRAVSARAGERGVWVLPGPVISVSGRDDVLRVAYAAVAGERLKDAVQRLVEALAPARSALPLV